MLLFQRTSTCIRQPIICDLSSSSEYSTLFWISRVPTIMYNATHLHKMKYKKFKKLNNLTKIRYLRTSICRTEVQCDGCLSCIPEHFCDCGGHSLCAKFGSGTNSVSHSQKHSSPDISGSQTDIVGLFCLSLLFGIGSHVS